MNRAAVAGFGLGCAALFAGSQAAAEGCVAVSLAGPESAAPALAARVAALGGSAEGLRAVVPAGVAATEYRDLLTRPGRMSLHAVIGSGGEIDPEGALIRDAGVTTAEVRVEAPGPVLFVAFDAAAAERLGRVTTDLLGDTVALALDGKVVLAPRIVEPILGGELVISGVFSEDELDRMALMIAAPLPTGLTIESVVEADCPTPPADGN